jgi:hypothetical protein
VNSLVDFNPAEDRIGLNLATFAALPVGSRPGCRGRVAEADAELS